VALHGVDATAVTPQLDPDGSRVYGNRRSCCRNLGRASTQPESTTCKFAARERRRQGCTDRIICPEWLSEQRPMPPRGTEQMIRSHIFCARGQLR
jgi:hypothetical protein